MPKQNRPLVRDGRIQARKKRTDRSYLRPAAEAQPADTAVIEEEILEDEVTTGADIAEVGVDAAPEEEAEPTREREFVAASAPAVTAAPAAAPPSARTAGSGRLPTTVRAIQQQGVRRRREFDIQALAVRDTQYAYHELRRIAVLTTMVIVTLIVLWIVLR